MIINSTCIAIPAAVWIASVQVEYPDRLALVWIAIFLDLFGVLSVVFAKRWAELKHSSWVANHPKWFDFFPAINIEHKDGANQCIRHLGIWVQRCCPLVSEQSRLWAQCILW